jgi:molecular chaperone GrpE (heat shock protein)
MMKTEPKKPTAAGPDVNAGDVDATATEADLLRQDLVRQNDAHLRLAAEFENFKRRTRQESESRAAAKNIHLLANCCRSSTISNGPWPPVPCVTPPSFIREWS